MADVVFSIKDLKKDFGDKTILDIKSFDFFYGKTYRIQGDNGCGKTTLLNTLTGLLDSDSGCIEKKYSHVGWVSSCELGLYPRLTGQENIQIFSKLMNQDVSPNLLNTWLENETFCSAFSTQYFKCSSGMKQVLKIFCSLIQKPNVLIMDEPFRTLSFEMRTFVARNLGKNPDIGTIIYTDHLLEDHLFDNMIKLELCKGELKCL